MMNFLKHTNSTRWKKRGALRIKYILSFSIIFLFIMTQVYISFEVDTDSFSSYENPSEFTELALESSAGLEIFQDPFKINFSNIWSFFNSKYKSDLNPELNTYYRYGNNLGEILSDNLFSIDNLLLYKTLLKDQIDNYETFDNYLKLQETELWYQSSVNAEEYGFVRSVDATTGEIIDDTRYLIDNLMPIFLLIENIGTQINGFTINSKYPKDSIEEIFNLVVSDQFWDETYSGFYHHNSTNYKYTESNFYAILALLEIHKYYEELGLDINIKNRAYELANITITKLIDELWDTTWGGFEYFGKNDWTTDTGSDYKYLETNAMAIITLLEYWIESGMKSSSIYYQYALDIFNLLEALWNSGVNAYEFSRDGTWLLSDNSSINLEANSVMMSACLKLFEFTGNLTYYNRAWELYETFENSFFDDSVNSYRTCIASPVDNNKNLNANLKLVEAYLKAFNIYNSTILNSHYNVTDEIPNYIFNQDTLNITSTYLYINSGKFFNVTTMNYEEFTIEYTIDDAFITYIFKNPIKEIISQNTELIGDNTTTLLYNITDDLEIGQDYSIYIIANTTRFGTAYNINYFNVISGLIYDSIQGLPSVLYQGPILNITLSLNNTRHKDIELTVSMEGSDIINEFQTINFISNVLTNVSFNLTTTLGAKVGLHILNFTLKKNAITYLEILENIQIGYSFDYNNFVFKNQIVKGENAFVSVNLINFLPNSTQNLNISFFEGDSLIDKGEVILKEKEIKTVYYQLDFSDTITHTIEAKMEISKETTIFYTKEFSIEVIPKFEIKSASFPEIVSQGESADFILVIQNNQESSESFSLYVNGEPVSTNINRMGPGINRIITSVIVSLNPYDFQSKSYIFELKDSSGEIIVKYYYVVDLELSAFNLIVYYMLPFIIPVAIIKHRLLKR
jgi:hypothetical protein